jgi:hypothetical protein
MPRTRSTARVAKNRGIKIAPKANDSFAVSVPTARRPLNNDIDLSSLVSNAEPHRGPVLCSKQPACHNPDTFYYCHINHIIKGYLSRKNRMVVGPYPSFLSDEI